MSPTPLTEVLEVVEREAEPGEVQHGVLQDRGVTDREHERSRSAQSGRLASYFITLVNSTWASGASDIAVP